MSKAKMKSWWINGLVIFVALGMGAGLFLFKYQVARQERKLKDLYRQINQITEEIHILQAQWSSDTNPERLQILVDQQTDWQKPQTQQITAVKDVQAETK